LEAGSSKLGVGNWKVMVLALLDILNSEQLQKIIRLQRDRLDRINRIFRIDDFVKSGF
jgi:hypothetical protein